MVNETSSSKSSDKDSSKSADSKKDVEKNKAEAAALGVEEQLNPKQQAFKSLRDHIAWIEKSVESRENRLILRVLRFDNKIRKQLSKTILTTLLEEYCPSLSTYLDDLTEEDDEKGSQAAELVLQLKRLLSPPPTPAHPLAAAAASVSVSAPVSVSAAKDEKKDDAMDIEKKFDSGPTPVPLPSALGGEVIPEVKAYLHHLLVLHFIDKKLYDEAATCSEALVNFLSAFNRRTLDWLSSKIYFYYDYSHSLINSLDRIRHSLLSAYRTACLQHNEPGQASLTVSILRNYVHYNLYAAADAFRSKASFPEQRSTAFLVRYLYYTGKIETVQLHYGEAYAHLSQALRKAPQKTALGFRVTVTKLLILVQLLMGEIPDRSTFSQADMKRTLFPYLELTRAVRVGDLAQFMSLQNRYRHVFERDGLTHLIMRLRHHVIKAGLRKINTAYSAISIKDIAEKLHLDSVEDAESIIVKAIGDGVMEATVNHVSATLQSNETGDVYSTNEPQTAFHKRIQFCLDIHNESVKAMHFPANAHKLFHPGMDDDEDEEDEEGNIREKTKKDNDKEEADDKKKKDEKKDEKTEKKK